MFVKLDDNKSKDILISHLFNRALEEVKYNKLCDEHIIKIKEYIKNIIKNWNIENKIIFSSDEEKDSFLERVNKVVDEHYLYQLKWHGIKTVNN